MADPQTTATKTQLEAISKQAAKSKPATVKPATVKPATVKPATVKPAAVPKQATVSKQAIVPNPNKYIVAAVPELQHNFPDIAEDLDTILGTFFPQAGEYAHVEQLGRPVSGVPAPAPKKQAITVDQRIEARLAATLDKVQKLSKRCSDPGTRVRLDQVMKQTTQVLDSLAPEEKGSKRSMSKRVLEGLARFKKDNPTLYRLFLICLVAALAPLVISALPALPLLGM